MTAQWTIDNDDGWLCRDGDPVVQLGKGDQSGLLDALNDGVRAARLVDDMAAGAAEFYADVVTWRTCLDSDGAWDLLNRALVLLGVDPGSSPGEVAALHHARQQEET